MTNDPKDRHVLVAAVRANAEVIVTFNTGDFPEHALKVYEVSAIHPDDFLHGGPPRGGHGLPAINLCPHLMVLENIMLAPRQVRRESKADAEAYAMDLLQRLKLLDAMAELAKSGVTTSV